PGGTFCTTGDGGCTGALGFEIAGTYTPEEEIPLPSKRYLVAPDTGCQVNCTTPLPTRVAVKFAGAGRAANWEASALCDGALVARLATFGFIATAVLALALDDVVLLVELCARALTGCSEAIE